MSSALRLAMILVLALATVAIGLIASNLFRPKPDTPTEASAPAPAAVQYLVAAHPLPVGSLVRDEDVAARAAPSGNAPPEAMTDTGEARETLRGSLVRRYLDTGDLFTQAAVLRPRDRGFLASVLAPDTRGVSVNVDAESGVSGLISPGDLVDVVLTQTTDKADAAHRAQSETVLRNVRVVAIDQEIVPIAPAANGPAGKAVRSVALQLTPEQVMTVTVSRELGKLSLAVRSAIDGGGPTDAGAVLDCDVSQEIARHATVSVYAGGKAQAFSVRREGAGRLRGCEAAGDLARNETAPAGSVDDGRGSAGGLAEDRR